MKILFPFDTMDYERWDRYNPQILPIAKKVKEFNIISEVQPDGFMKRFDNVYFDRYSTRKKKDMKIEYSDSRILNPLRYGNVFFKGVKRLIVFKEFAKKYKNADVDLIYGLSGSGYIQNFFLELKKLLDVPIVYRMRGYGIRERKINQRLHRRYMNDVLDIYSSRNYDYYIPIKYLFREILLKRGVELERISYPVINGVDTELFKPQKMRFDTGKVNIGYAGRISPVKGIDFLTRLMNETKDFAHYYVCGLNQMNWKPPKNCTYYGRIAHELIPVFINGCDIMILPSLSEGVSNIILESYACGKVLICSPFAIPDEIPSYGFKCKMLFEWINTIKGLNENYLKERGKLAREWAVKNSWDSFGNKMYKIFKGVTKNE